MNCEITDTKQTSRWFAMQTSEVLILVQLFAVLIHFLESLVKLPMLATGFLQRTKQYLPIAISAALKIAAVFFSVIKKFYCQNGNEDQSPFSELMLVA